VVREPKIFLFDEPLSNLDAELRVQMRTEIGSLHQRLGNTMIYVTHDQVEAMTMADRIAVLKDGRLEQFGRPLDLYNRPANLFVAGFIGSPRMNFLGGTLIAGSAREASVKLDAGGMITVPCEAAVGAGGVAVKLGVRPEHIGVVENGQGDARLSVAITEQLGGESYLHGALPSGEKLSVRLAGQTRVNRGETVGLKLADPALRRLFNADTGKAFAPLE
jgi:multiple sugar transport system ATP-binding protein